jgi:hypothetical protein
LEAIALGQCVQRMDSRIAKTKLCAARPTVLCHAQLYHDRATHLRNSQATRRLLARFSWNPRCISDATLMVAAPTNSVLAIARLAALAATLGTCVELPTFVTGKCGESDKLEQ